MQASPKTEGTHLSQNANSIAKFIVSQILTGNDVKQSRLESYKEELSKESQQKSSHSSRTGPNPAPGLPGLLIGGPFENNDLDSVLSLPIHLILCFQLKRPLF
jgi:hypothetical protein